MLRFLALLGLAGLAFTATSSWIRSWVPLPEDFELAARLEELRTAADPYDLVFLGPSTSRCAFDPHVIDEELTRLGHPAHSLNLGVPGATSFEIDHLVEQIVARPPPGLRWLVIELHPAEPSQLIRPANLFTDRAVYWHTPRQLRDVLAALLHPRSGRTIRVDRMALHVRHALWRFANVGQADRIVAHALGRDSIEEPDPRRGFAPEDCVEGRGMQAARQRYLSQPEKFRRQAMRLDRQDETPVPTEHLDPTKLRRQIRSLRGIGVEPVYVLTPVLSPVPGIHSLHRQRILPTLLAFDSPRRFPELYAPRNRWDELHLNEAGAELFSRQFAQRFARWLDTGLER